MKDKERQLYLIAEEISVCGVCQMNTQGLPVPGEGNPDARIMIIGEAPGRMEAKTGRPFIGPSGKLLTRLLSSIGIERPTVFITSILKYFPGKRPITPGEIEHGKIHLEKQISVIRPELLIVLGNTAKTAFLGTQETITALHGKERRYHGYPLFITFHPAAALRSPQMKRMLEEDFKTLEKLLPSPK